MGSTFWSLAKVMQWQLHAARRRAIHEREGSLGREDLLTEEPASSEVPKV
jgi:hypothetical protein